MDTVPGTEKCTVNISLIDSVNQMSYFANYVGKKRTVLSSELPNYFIRNLQCSEINIYKILPLGLKMPSSFIIFPPLMLSLFLPGFHS